MNGIMEKLRMMRNERRLKVEAERTKTLQQKAEYNDKLTKELEAQKSAINSIRKTEKLEGEVRDYRYSGVKKVVSGFGGFMNAVGKREKIQKKNKGIFHSNNSGSNLFGTNNTGLVLGNSSNPDPFNARGMPVVKRKSPKTVVIRLK